MLSSQPIISRYIKERVASGFPFKASSLFFSDLNAGIISFCDNEKDFFKNARPTSIIQRFASVDEVANLVTYVASPLSSATNGAALRVDGGVVKTAV